MSHFFSLSQPLFSSLGSAFEFVSSNIVEDLLINPSAYVFVLRDFHIYHKDWLTYSDGTGRFGELYCNFFISNHLTQMVNVPTRIPDCDSQSPALLNVFFSPDLSTFSIVILPLKGSPDQVLSSKWL